jgi:hypothetical protein
MCVKLIPSPDPPTQVRAALHSGQAASARSIWDYIHRHLLVAKEESFALDESVALFESDK